MSRWLMSRPARSLLLVPPLTFLSAVAGSLVLHGEVETGLLVFAGVLASISFLIALAGYWLGTRLGKKRAHPDARSDSEGP